ncbi:Reverse gyrase 1 [Candidatus Norongarragalina meridionalis]|nr:Reverse gyrase 1 [Candidatus Norongarragalina meridionalis]
MRLILTEKPSVAAKMVRALAPKAVQKKLQGVAYYEFERDGQKYAVAPAVGHLYSLKQAGAAAGRDYPVYEIEWAPAFEVSKGAAFSKKYWAVLKNLAASADSVIAATDYDIEGSLIAYNIAKFLAKGKPLSRMKFSVLTDDALSDSFEHQRSFDETNALAGDARHRLDWLWGINLSRALMSAIKTAGVFRVMSIGRVQGPALAMLSEKEREIAAFKAVPYWQVFALASSVTFEHKTDRFWKEDEAKKAVANSSKDGVVLSVERKRVEAEAPAPFDLTTMQMESYQAFGFSPAKTLEIAQKLYEAALISYPRTSSQKLPQELGLKKIIAKVGENPEYAALASKLLAANRIVPKDGAKTDPAHPAIYATGQRPGPLTVEEKKLYDLIARRFLACFAPSAFKENLSVSARFGTEEYDAKGSTVTEKGWLEYYPYAKQDEKLLPNFTEGQKLLAEKIWSEAKETQPPKRYTPASIVKELESRELGTKATRAEVIETLYNRGYIAEPKSIRVTAFGLAVADALSHNCPDILSEELTRGIEHDMELIADGKKKSETVVETGRKELSRMLDIFRKQESAIGKELLVGLNEARSDANTLGKCKCGGNLVMRKSKYGIFVGCDAYPKCTNTYPLPKEASVTPMRKTCEKCGTPIVLIKRKGKRPWRMCLDTNCPTKASWGQQKD